jgi:hypothetical protein
VDSNGAVFLSKGGVKRRAAIDTRHFLESNKKLHAHLEKNFPQGSIHHATDPVVRAMKYKMTGGQTILASLFRNGDPISSQMARPGTISQ